MLFVTNRALNESIQSHPGRNISFDLENNDAGQSLYYVKRNNKDDYTELGSAHFLNELKSSPKEQLLFFIHGFNNIPERDIFPRAQKLETLLNQQNISVEVVPVIWPCRESTAILSKYYNDQISADASCIAFSRALERFVTWRNSNIDAAPCTKRINILAHSMGNRVLRGAIHYWAKTFRSWEVPYFFRNTFMVAADVVNESLQRDQDGIYICQSSRNVVVYYAADDLALISSKVANLPNAVASRRLGHTGPERMELTPDNVYAVDCDDVNTKYDLPKGHTYFLTQSDGQPGLVFDHIASCLQTGRVTADASRRHLIG